MTKLSNFWDCQEDVCFPDLHDCQRGDDLEPMPTENGTTRRPSSDSPGGSAHDLGVRSTTHAFHDLGKPIAGVGKAVEVVLALAAAVDDSPVT